MIKIMIKIIIIIIIDFAYPLETIVTCMQDRNEKKGFGNYTIHTYGICKKRLWSNSNILI